MGWPATVPEWESRGSATSPVRADDVSLGEHQGWHYIQHRPSDDPAAGRDNSRYEGD